MRLQHESNCADSFIVDWCSAGHAASQVSMSRAGSGSDLHSHMPGGVLIQVTAARRGVVLIGPVAMEPRGDLGGAEGPVKHLTGVESGAGSLKVI